MLVHIHADIEDIKCAKKDVAYRPRLHSVKFAVLIYRIIVVDNPIIVGVIQAFTSHFIVKQIGSKNEAGTGPIQHESSAIRQRIGECHPYRPAAKPTNSRMHTWKGDIAAGHIVAHHRKGFIRN